MSSEIIPTPDDLIGVCVAVELNPKVPLEAIKEIYLLGFLDGVEYSEQRPQPSIIKKNKHRLVKY